MTAKNPNDTQPENVIDFRGHSRTDPQNKYIDTSKADQYRSTGKCDDPKLKQVVKLLRSGKEVISPSRAKRLTQALTQNVEIVEKAAYSLGYNLQLVGLYLQEQPEPIQDDYIKAIEQRLELEQKDLAQGIYRLFNIAKKHPQPTTGKLTPEQNADNLRYQKLVNDIDYIRRFLVEQAHISVVFFEQSPHPKAYLRRSLNYLDFLPRYCGELAARTRRNIFDKVPGTQSDDLEA
ncbi:MAG: hypothetical protein JGK26_09895 [Microcoleus sp. PH2017_27_LUM_O_A]|nr:MULTISPECIES: hypothetical protein [unclassified Microcoleus]MCC3460086.1 hypothetical protein [Microcoleus sp. PH2017_11_PCY_U_A]MCC3478560.1 hypothetical protein [Microcoleus sp. PH2017_12_PCY_D_A]MCC3559437.1 hypothetical protein [Microcoleus sp. PH2017_27_LUM_O_A]